MITLTPSFLCALSAAICIQIKFTILCPFIVINFLNPCFARDCMISYNNSIKISALTLIVPGNAKWCGAHPVQIGGAIRTPVFSLASPAKDIAVKVSVPKGSQVPCCSVLPTGIIILSSLSR
ncbi:hypothetical protein ES705_32818 [subsurface metagenome]